MHVTLIAEGHVEDSIYDAVRSHFTDKGSRRPDLCRGYDQRLEPPGYLRTNGTRQIPAGQSTFFAPARIKGSGVMTICGRRSP